MRFLTLILILYAIISCDCFKYKDNLNVVVNASLLRTYDSIYFDFDSIRHKIFDVRLSIINKTNKPITFWTMTCSWQDNFIVNNDYIKFNFDVCNHNYPRMRHLYPNDSLIYKTSVRKIDMTLGQIIKTTKFGFIYIDSAQCNEKNDYDIIIRDRSKQDKIIWSNPLFLKETK
jgi:hypothetical protein